MKDSIIPILILLSVIVATIMFRNNIAGKNDDIDKIETALAGAKKLIPPGSAINFQSIPVKNELSFWARYALAPNYLAMNQHTYDTTLTISSLAVSDSVTGVLTGNGGRIVWQNKDDQYCYFLTTAH